MGIGRLHVITDTRPGRDPLALARFALDAGAPVLQVRAKAFSDRAFYEFALAYRALCAEYGATCLIDNRADVAVAVGAHGAHVGAHDLPVAAARAVLGPAGVLGATARDPATAGRHQAAGASYLGVGPAYATTTKDGLPAPLGPDGIARVVAATSLPVVAIGGVTPARVPELLAAGVHGVAVIGAVADSDDPRAAVRELLAALEAAA